MLCYVMGRKCSVVGCSTGFKTCEYKGTFHGFPNDKEKRQGWIDALPNKDTEFTEFMGICDLYWLPDCKKKKIKRWFVPDEPPSIFHNFPDSCLKQTTSQLDRSIDDRRISQEAINELIEKRNKKDLENRDQIKDWNAFVEHCRGINLVRRESDTGINLMKISNDSPPEVLFSIEISTDFKVTCYVKSSKVNVRNLSNAFNHKLEKYSQLNNIISVLGDTNVSLNDEVKTCAKK